MVNTDKSLDVIIPSFRFANNQENIARVASLACPPEWCVQFYLIGDNPAADLPPSLAAMVANGKINFLPNTKNEGLNYCRNKGITVTSGTWILILDDDIIPQPGLLFAYIHAIEKNPGKAFFAGLVNFPEPDSRFTKALVAAGYTYYFSRAKNSNNLPWATGANMLFNRQSIGDIRFSDAFSGNEGGDEVEFALQLRAKKDEGWVAVPDAAVLHPWWHNGKVRYDRAFKYSRGNYTLLKLHPEYAVYRFCNLLEMLLIFFILTPFTRIAGIDLAYWLLFIVSAVLASLCLHTARFITDKKQGGAAVVLHTWILKLAEQAGYLSACLQNGWLRGLFTRFDIELGTGKQRHFHTNRWIIMHMVAFTLLFLLFCRR